AAGRRTELSRLLAEAPTREAADALRRELAWTRDDHERAMARVAELRGRLARVTRPDGAESPRTERQEAGEAGARGGDAGAAGAMGAAPAVSEPPGNP
ncbi:hypothetical protein NGM37_61860, partial [Streptomyces sp. TRM76130]|nr:hypothetical protein [Streptomyces sp. TRM76130]